MTDYREDAKVAKGEGQAGDFNNEPPIFQNFLLA